jgi:Ca-activated chloride channel family protein
MRAFIIVLLFVLPLAAADSGVLIPGDRNAPDPNILSLEEMALDILIDNGTARVAVREIFANHTGRNLEGTYSFALPVRAVLSDFAVWDELTRIPGVILERKRAGEIYDSLRSQTIDPGILQMGERGAQEAARSSEFTARVTPIPARGTKRVEIEYHERVPVEQFESVLAIPLKPDTYQAQLAGRLDVNLTLLSERRIAGFDGIGKAYPLKINERSPNRIRASYSGTGVALTEDFAVKYSARWLQYSIRRFRCNGTSSTAVFRHTKACCDRFGRRTASMSWCSIRTYLSSPRPHSPPMRTRLSGRLRL